MNAPDPTEVPRRTPGWQKSNPFLALALAGAAGILAADGIDPAPWTALGCSLLASLAWARWRRLALCWFAVATGFAALHAFSLHPWPEETLARRLSSQAQAIRARGRVVDEPRYSSTGATARFVLELERIEAGGHAWKSHARVLTGWQDGAPERGDRLEIVGTARNLAPPRNPGEFDFADHERRQGILSEIRCRGRNDVRVVARESRASLGRMTVRFHDWMRDSLGLGLTPGTPPAAVISTVLLGLRDHPGLGEAEDVFQRTGTLHYFAIDGLKLALLSCLGLWIMHECRLPRRWARTLSLPPLVFYVVATGLGPASVRATLVAAMLIGAFWIERPGRPLNLLGAAAALILFYDTNELFGLGFQLTFLVVLAVITLAGPLQRKLATIGAPDPFLPRRLHSRARRGWEVVRFWGWGLVSVSLVAWLGSLPIMVLQFHVVSPISPLANVVTFPLAWTVLTLGVAVLGVAAVGATPAAAALNGLNLLTAQAFLAAVHFFDAVPHGSFYVSAPAEWTLGARPAAELTVLDLGGARAMHLRAGGADWLIDAAQPFDYSRSVRPYLRARGVDRLEGLILSQADTRHLGAASLAWLDFARPRVVDSTPLPGRSPRRQEFLRLLQSHGRSAEILPAGSTLALAGGAELRAFHPPAGLRSGAASDRSLVLQLRAAGRRVLLLADAEQTVERWLLAHVSPDDLRSDAVVTGAVDAPGEDFLRTVAPRVIVSQSLDAHPGVLSTRASGAISLRLWPDRVDVSGFSDGSQQTLTASP